MIDSGDIGLVFIGFRDGKGWKSGGVVIGRPRVVSAHALSMVVAQIGSARR